MKTALIALPVLYVLSIGPVALIQLTYPQRIDSPMNRALNVFYKPLELLYEHTLLQAPLEVYIRWWNELGGGKP